MTNYYAVVYQPAVSATRLSAPEDGPKVEPEVTAALLVDPRRRLPQLPLATVVQEAGLGRLTAARSLVDAMRFVVSTHPSVIIAAWSAQLPHLLGALDDCYAAGHFPQVTVAAESQQDYETALSRCDRFAVIVVHAEQLVRCLVQRLARQQGA